MTGGIATGATERERRIRMPPAAVASLLSLSGVLCMVVSSVAHQTASGGPAVVALALLMVLVPGIVGVLIVGHAPGHRIGWLLCVDAGLVGVGLATPPAHPHATWVLALGQLSAGWWVLLYVGLVAVAYVFPTGHTLSRRWHRWLLLCLAGYAIFIVGSATDRSRLVQAYPGARAPLPTLPPGVAQSVGFTGLVLVGLSLVGAVGSMWQRLRRAEGVERLQVLWFTWAALSLPLGLGICIVSGSEGLLTLVGVAVMGCVLPAAIGVAILRHRLFDIELVLSRTVVYAGLTVAVVAVYAAVLWLSELGIDNTPVAGLLGVGAVAVVVQPVHAALRSRVERWVYGDRHTPGLALLRLSTRVADADDAGVLTSVTGAVADALRVHRVWIEPPGQPVDDPTVVRVPLVHRGDVLGDLALSLPHGRTLSRADLTLLHDLARHAAVVVQAARLTEDLRASRAQIVAGREEERRRMRRDLHDGLGPSLAAIVLRLNTAQHLVDDEGRNRLLQQAREETKAAISEVRRLVDDLRPPAIDEVGLVGAIRQRAASLCDARDLAVEVTSPAMLPALPAAVEAAAYRIVAEALTNVVRHSTATRCAVRIALDGAFEVTVTDNGDGASDGPPGLGWTSMVERAQELGGSCTITSRPSGVTVRAVLPLPGHDHVLVST
jgi:two-component system, NarL family, sensor kinase